MKKNFRTIKATLIMGILLVSVSATIVPTTSAGLLANLSSYARVEFDAKNFTGKPVVPRGEIRPLPIVIFYGVNYAGLIRGLANFLFLFQKGRQVDIKLELVDWSPWCTPTITQSTLTTMVADDEQELKANLNLRVDLDAPAYGSGYVTVKVIVPKVGSIDKYENEFTLEFDPAYLPLIKPQTQGSNTKRIGPMDTAVFPIEIENLGNARTKIKLQVVSESVPDGWTAIVTDQVILDEEKGSMAIAYLTIKPPKTFGYHDETSGIVVEMVPERAENPSDKGSPERISVLVESRGFSVIGIEMLLLPLVIIVVIIFLIYYFIIRKRKI
jgi:hypothetical protein